MNPARGRRSGSANVTLVYREGIFIGRVCGHTVYDCTGRLRAGDEFCRFVLGMTGITMSNDTAVLRQIGR
jgi:hypothetical protein